MGQVRKTLTLLVFIIGFSVVISAPAKKSKCDGKGLTITPSEQSCLLGHMLEVLTQLINNQKHPICLKTQVPKCFHDSVADQNKTELDIRDNTSDRSYNEDSASETYTNEDTSEECKSAELYPSSTESQPTSKAYEYPEEEYEDISKDLTTAATEDETETTEKYFSDVIPTTAASGDVKENIYEDISTDIPLTTPATNDKNENTEEYLNEGMPTTTAASKDESENVNEDNSTYIPLTAAATEDESIPTTTEAPEDTNDDFLADIETTTIATPEPTILSVEADTSFAATATEPTDLNSVTYSSINSDVEEITPISDSQKGLTENSTGNPEITESDIEVSPLNADPSKTATEASLEPVTDFLFPTDEGSETTSPTENFSTNCPIETQNPELLFIPVVRVMKNSTALSVSELASYIKSVFQ